MQFIKKHLFFYLATFVAVLTAVLLCANLYSSAASVSASLASPLTVIIDAGHGGEDGGAAVAGVQESGLNLAVSEKLEQLLHLLGFHTAMTRREDVSLHSEGARSVSEKKVSDLKNRVRAVNAVPNGVLVSIHQNMFEQEKYSGAQVFYADNAASRALAERMQELLSEGLDRNNRRTAKEKSTVFLLKNAACPAVLVECGFLSNGAERRLLCTEDYQKRIALSVGAALTEYIREADHHDES